MSIKLLVSGSTSSVAAIKEHRDRLGILLTPNNRNSVETVLETGLPWAIDNGAFSGFNPNAFMKLCLRAENQPRLLWVACPDVVADAAATLQWFRDWSPALHRLKLPVAFVAQDGLTTEQTPWDGFECLFLGGTTEWKLSHAAEDLAHEAKDRGKLVHMGRVNSQRRMQFAQLFKCDSIDGSSASMFGDRYIHRYLAWLKQLSEQPLLPEAKA